MSLVLKTNLPHLLKISNSNSSIQTDIDYLYATLNKFSAIHQVPYSWVLKYGAIWHRYKVWVESNRTTDILDNVWKDFDYKLNYNPINGLTTNTYNLLDFQNNPIQYVLQTSTNQVINNITRQFDNINLGFYPNVTIKDSAGNILETGIDYNSLNQITLTMAQPFGGTAYLS